MVSVEGSFGREKAHTLREALRKNRRAQTFQWQRVEPGGKGVSGANGLNRKLRGAKKGKKNRDNKKETQKNHSPKQRGLRDWLSAKPEYRGTVIRRQAPENRAVWNELLQNRNAKLKGRTFEGRMRDVGGRGKKAKGQLTTTFR